MTELTQPATALTDWVPQAVTVLVVLLTILAATHDTLTYTIANVFPVTLVVLFLLVALTGAWPLNALGLSVGLALTVFAIGAGLFFAGLLGGGDVKLLAALTLWVQPGDLLAFMAWVAIAGGGIALVLLAGRLLPEKIKKSHEIIKNLFTDDKENRRNMPYGLAIMAGTLVIWGRGGLGPPIGSP